MKSNIGIPHKSQEPDVYKGYYFPAGMPTLLFFCFGSLIKKGTTFVPNVIGVLQDEAIFPEPKKFKPERFLNENVGFDPQNMGGFGFGRRYTFSHSACIIRF